MVVSLREVRVVLIAADTDTTRALLRSLLPANLLAVEVSANAIPEKLRSIRFDAVVAEATADTAAALNHAVSRTPRASPGTVIFVGDAPPEVGPTLGSMHFVTARDSSAARAAIHRLLAAS